MKMQAARSMLAAAGFLLIATGSAVAATGLAQRDLEYFTEESYACRDSDPNVDWEYLLCQAIEEDKSVAGSMKSFATKIGRSEGDALIIATAIIEITRFDNECDRYSDENEYDCRFERGAPAYDRFVEANRVDASGELAFVVGKTVGSDYAPTEQRRRFLELVIEHPGRLLTFRRMLDYTRNDLWIFAVAAAGDVDVETAKLIFLRHYYNSMHESPNWDGSSTTLLELLLARNPDDEVRRFLSYALISLQMRAGMSDVAVSTYLKLPERLRTYAPTASDETAQYEGDRLFENYIGFTVELAAALIEQKRPREARALLAESTACTGDFEKVQYSITARARTMNEVLKPSLGADQVFDYFIHGRLSSDPEIETDEPRLSGGPGWLFQIEDSAPAARTITAGYLEKRGYKGMARYLIDRELYHRSDRRDALIDLLLPMLADDYAERQGRWKAKIEAAWSAHEAKRRKPARLVAEASNPPIAAPRAYEERPLPPAYQTAESDPQLEDRFSPNPPEGVALPVDDFQLVRYAEERGERQIIFLSSALDAPGEIPAYGYWFQQTRAGMTEWEEAIYLGLQQYFPYVIVSRSKLPLFEVGGLVIEVEAREIDRASISFPPVGLSLKREERNLYLAFQLDELKRDSDADGLADLVERRLQLNPNSPDTDGDGLTDVRDPLPLTAFDPQAPLAKKELAYAILSTVVGYERGAIVVSPSSPGAEIDLSGLLGAERPPAISDGAVFLVAEPSLFAGVRTPFRLFVFSSDEVERINAQGAPFYPARVSAVFSRLDDSERYVIWSAGWVGGEFIVRCKADQCETEVTSRWIT